MYFKTLERMKRPVPSYNCKHILFVMRQLGIPLGDPILAKDVLSRDDIVRIKEACLELVHQDQVPVSSSTQQVFQPQPLQKLQQQKVPSQHSPPKSVSNASFKPVEHFYETRKLVLAGLRGLNREPRWYACRYARPVGTRGPPRQCSTDSSSGNPHQMKGETCERKRRNCRSLQDVVDVGGRCCDGCCAVFVSETMTVNWDWASSQMFPDSELVQNLGALRE